MTSPLALAHERLGWPRPKDVFAPREPGARVFAQDVDRRIGGPLRRFVGSDGVRVGLLAADGGGGSSPVPIALVCEFTRPPSQAALRLAHRLAWNYSRAALLLTVDPHVIRAWTCCELPPRDGTTGFGVHEEPNDYRSPVPAATGPELDQFDVRTIGEASASVLHWVSLASGAFAARYPRRFPKKSRADVALLENLRAVRQLLCNMGLPAATAHDLIARVIFIQFLFDRKDADGRAALTPERLRAWHSAPADDALRLSSAYETLESVLTNVDDAYRLFERLNRHFNGDLFASGADNGWESERALVAAARGDVFGLLATLVRGNEWIEPGQLSLWDLYAFDVIPLEFISSIYEEFVAKDPGVVYTPPGLADFVLDAVLPWDGRETDVRVLDPACGSGVFLVKAYQRLVHRWRRQHKRPPDAATLTRLLRDNLVGVDRQHDAVRIAAFSLYLALCDEVEPRDVWEKIELPRLCGEKLLEADFFSEDVEGIRTEEDRESYDLVVGNAPWASGSLRESAAAQAWSVHPSHRWESFEASVGPLFLPKAAALVKRRGGRVALIQAASLLVSENAAAFREQMFTTFDVVEVVNFAGVRRELFEGADAPACLVTLRPTAPTPQPIAYLCPKPTSAESGAFRLVLDPHDVAWVTKDEAARERFVWTALCWGGRRELDVVRRLAAEGDTIGGLRSAGVLDARNGIVWGRSSLQEVPDLAGRRELFGSELPTTDGVHLDPTAVDRVHATTISKKDSRDLRAFATPQLILKRSWDAETGRFHAAIVSQDDFPRGVICSQSFVTVHADPEHESVLRSIFATFVSPVSVFYHLMSSARVSAERPNLSPGDIFAQPIATGRRPPLSRASARDDFVYAAFDLDETERIVIEDAATVTMQDLHRGQKGPGNRSARPRPSSIHGPVSDPLDAYAEAALSVLAASFGAKVVSAQVFDTPAALGIRLVAFNLDGPPGGRRIRRAVLDNEHLMAALREWTAAQDAATHASVPLPRVARLYVSERVGRRAVPVAVVLKPDRLRYWTRAIGLRDADDIVADAVTWAREYTGEESGPRRLSRASTATG